MGKLCPRGKAAAKLDLKSILAHTQICMLVLCAVEKKTQAGKKRF